MIVTKIIGGLGNQKSRFCDLSHRPRPVGRRTVIHTARLPNQRSRRLRGRVHVKGMKCRHRAVRGPAVNNARALGSALLRGEKNPSLTLRHGNSLGLPRARHANHGHPGC